MNEPNYRALREGRRAVFAQIKPGYIEVTGRDRLSFLQGQLSNDVASLQPGSGCRACLLNNTGHLLAEVRVYELGDRALIETDSERAAVVAATLDRYVIRERVAFRIVTDDFATVTVQGPRADEIIAATGIPALEDGEQRPQLWNRAVEASDGEQRICIVRDRTGAGGYDVVSPAATVSDVIDMILYSEFASPLDSETLEVLRIEAGIPSWGRELDESIIPLEAQMDDAISYTKGCYVGQEIIARIHSRGHVNKSLRLIQFTGEVEAGAELFGKGGTKDGARIGRITSAVKSPALGWIALGYVHVDYSSPLSAVIADEVIGEVKNWPPDINSLYNR